MQTTQSKNSKAAQRDRDTSADETFAPNVPGSGPAHVRRGGRGSVKVDGEWITGEGFQKDVEAVMSFSATDGREENNIRISKWVTDGTFRVQVPTTLRRGGHYRLQVYVPEETAGKAPASDTRQLALVDEVAFQL